MNIYQLERSLPYGFHDAELTAVRLDYATKQATLSLRLWVGSEATDPVHGGQRAIMRKAELHLVGLRYFVIEAPASTDPEDLALDVSGGAPPPNVVLPAASESEFVYSFYVSNWNSHIILAAADAELVWLEPPSEPDQ